VNESGFRFCHHSAALGQVEWRSWHHEIELPHRVQLEFWSDCMRKIANSRSATLFVLLNVCFAIGLRAQVSTAGLNEALLGKTVAPTVEVGYEASTKNPMLVNGRPAMFPVKTQIYPDGREFYRIEYGILHADADKYTTFKREAVFQITKIEAKNDCLEIEMPVSINSSIPDPKLKAYIQLKFGKGWQSSMSTDQVLAQIERYLPKNDDVASVQPDVTKPSSVVMTPAQNGVRVNLAALDNLLAGKTIYPTIKIASKGISSRLIITANGPDKLPPAITLVFPDGHVEYDAQPGPLGSRADQFQPLPVFDEGLRIGRVSAADSYIEIEVLFTSKGVAVSNIDPGHVRFMLGLGWQSSMTTESVLQAIVKILPDKAE